MDTVSPPQYRIQICQLPFTHNPTRYPTKISGLLVSYTNCKILPLTTFATNLKQHTNSSSNHITPRSQHPLTPLFHPHPHGTYNLLSVFSTLLLKKATVFSLKLLLCFEAFYYASKHRKVLTEIGVDQDEETMLLTTG